MKKVVFILLISCVFALKAQETKLVVPGFHTSIVKSIAISGDNIYVATTSTDHSLKVWEYATGRLLTEFICEEDAKSALFTENDSHLIFNDTKNWYVLDMASLKVINQGKFPYRGLVYQVDLGTKPNTFVYGYLEDQTNINRIIELNFNTSQSNEIYNFQGESRYDSVSKVSISETGKFALIRSREQELILNLTNATSTKAPSNAEQFLDADNLLLYDSSTRSIKSENVTTKAQNWMHKLPSIPFNAKYGSELEFYYDKQFKELSAMQGNYMDHALTVVAINSGTKKDYPPLPEARYVNLFKHGNELVSVTYDPYKMEVWDASSLVSKVTFGSSVFPASYIDGRTATNTFGLATFYKKATKILQIKDRKFNVKSFSTELGNRVVKPNDDGQVVAARSDYYKGSFPLYIAVTNTVQKIDFSKFGIKPLAVATSGDGNRVAVVVKDQLVIYNSKDGSLHYNEKISEKEVGWIGLELVFAKSDKILVLQRLDYGKYIMKCFSSSQKKLLWEQETESSNFTFISESELMGQSNYSDAIVKINANTGAINSSRSFNEIKVSSSISYNSDYSIMVQKEDSQIGVYNFNTGTSKKFSTKINSELIDVWAYEKDFIFATAKDASLRLWDIRDGELLAKIVFFDDDEWVIVTADGKFDGTQGGISKLYFVKGKTFINLEQLYEKYFTPGLLAQLLNRTPNSGPDATPVPNIDDISFPPSVTISYKEGSRNLTVEDDETIETINTKNGKASITVNATARGSKVAEVRLFHNGKRVAYTTRNLTVEDDVEEAALSKTFNVDLLPGENVFKAIALNTQRTESAPAKLAVKYEETEIANNTGGLKLHLIVVGIDQYKNKKYNLNYAVADASSFKNSIADGIKSITSSQNVIFIKNEDASREAIKNTFESIAKIANPQDVFIFYYAGHGVMSEGEKKDFYLVPYDVTQLYGNDGALAKKGISATELKSFSSNISAQKQLYILDACQSAGALKTIANRGAAEEKAIAQLARSTGTHWLTASGSEQFATEFDELGHGVFTYALLEALSGKADSGDNRITVNELKAYIESRVPEISAQYKGSPQYPSSFGFGQDFPVGIKN